MRRSIALFVVFLSLAAAASAQQVLRRGQPAPDFNTQSLDGQLYSLTQLQGKVVVLTFWSTRCQICHEEIPKLNRVADRYRGRDVVFLGVTMDNQVKIEPYLRKTPFNFSILPNSFDILLKYADRDGQGNINIGFPAYYVIDRRGLIQMRASGWDKSANLESEIAELLSE
jgi:peroxiredoxin